MIPVSQSAQVDFLLFRKFPKECSLSSIAATPIHDHPQAFRDYKNKLLSMPNAELQALYAREKEQEDRAKQAMADLAERSRFFHLSSASADFEHWSKATYWSLGEAVALTFGKAPEVVN